MIKCPRVVCALTFCLAIGCGSASDPASVSTSDQAEGQAGAARAADPCALLMAADPASVIGEPLAEAVMVAPTMCSVNRSGDFLKSAGLNLTGGPASGLSREGFFALQQEGLELLGLGLEDLHEVDGIGDLCVWAEYTGGMQLWVFWSGQSGQIILNGISSAEGLEWAQALARRLIAS